MMEETMIAIRDPKTFYSDLDWPKGVYKNFSLKLNSSEKAMSFSLEWYQNREWTIIVQT